MSFYIHSKKNEANKDLIDISDQLKTYYTSPSKGAFKINNNLNSEAEFLQNTLVKSTPYTDNNNSTGFKIRNKYDITQNINTIKNFIEPNTPFVFKINIANSGDEFILPIVADTVYDFIVDWGDSVLQNFQYTSTNKNLDLVKKQYTEAIEYTISISGVFPTVNLKDNTQIIEILSFGSSLTSLENSFEGCTSITKVTSGFSKNLINCKSMCRGCIGLETFDTSGLFFVETVDNAWTECVELVSFNTKGLIKTINADNAWRGCTKLANFDAVGLVKLDTFEGAWLDGYQYTLGTDFVNYEQLTNLDEWIPGQDSSTNSPYTKLII
jgi:hypothetical protein